MWGLKFHFYGDRVELGAPGWLLNAAATYAAIDLVKCAVTELSRAPELYGYDPENGYTLFFQTWDRAISGVQSIAFGRDVAGQSAVGLVPDVYYLGSQGFSGVREAALMAPPWHQRASTIVWRGSVTGSGPYERAADIPRVRLAVAMRDLPDTDVALFGIHPTMESVFSPAEIAAEIARESVEGDHWPLAKFGQYKFAIDIDGHANAWGFLEKLILGCCVLKVASPYEQWFYSRLRPWTHYVPVKADLSDLAEKIAWVRDNDARCAWIAHNGAVLAALLNSEAELPRSCATILAAAHADPLPSGWGQSTANVAPALPEAHLLGEARRLEGLGQLDQAIAIYTRLSDAGLGGAEALLRRSSLHRERGELQFAMAALTRAVAKAPHSHEPKLRLAQLLISIGRDTAAAVELLDALRQAPWLEELRVNLSDLCYRLNWLDVAYWAVRKLPEGLPDWWARARNSALTHFEEQRDRTMAALRARKRGVDLEHGARWELAVRLTSLGKLAAARRLCERIIETSPSVFAPRELMSKIIARRDGSAAALDYLRALPAEVQHQGDYAIRVGRCLLDLGRYQEVLDEAGGRPAIADSFDARFMIAVSCMSLGRSEALQTHCRAWMAAAPEEVLPAGIVCTAQPVHVEEEPAAPVLDNVSLFQFWDTSEIPADVRDVIETWSTQHPGLRCQVFNEEDGRDYLQWAFGTEVATAYDLCYHAAMKADLFRIGVLYQSGGLWVDADEHCIRAMPAILAAAARSEITAVRSGDILGYLHNYFLGARAGSRPLEIALEAATRDIHAANRDGRQLSIWEATGPGLITRAVGNYIIERPERCGEDLILLPLQQYGSFARTRGDLGYKSLSSANWQLV